MLTSLNISDVLSMLSSQSLQLMLPSIISHLLTFIVVFLSVVLLHDALVRSKQLNASWWSQIVSPLGSDHPPSPPGPWWNLPLLGYLPWLGSKPYVTMWNLSRRYGSVYQIRLGGRNVVVLNGRQTIRSAFMQESDKFAGRPDFPSFGVFSEGHSMAFTSINADHWITQRKLALHVLRMFTGNKKYATEALVHRHAVALADQLIHDSAPVDRDGRPVAVDPFSAIESTIFGILFEVCFGAAGDGDRELYSQLIQKLHEMRAVMPSVQSVDIMPWMAPFLHGPLRIYANSLRRIHQLTSNKTETLISTGVHDVQACIVHELHQACLTEDFDGSQRAKIMALVEDFIGAGSETSVYYIHWAILYAAKYPSLVQERIREEIGRTIGWTSAPVASDRGRMPYTEACMWEIMRHSCMAPTSIPHAAVRDANIAGYSIAAGTVVFANFYSTGWDPDDWDDPAAFRPERFMTPDGSQVDREVVNQFMCFGVGRRRCPAAQFSTLQIFLIFVVLMQRCVFSVPPGHELSTDGHLVLMNQARKYVVLVQPVANDDADLL